MNYPSDVNTLLKRIADLIIENQGVFQKSASLVGKNNLELFGSSERCFNFLVSHFRDTFEIRAFLINAKKHNSVETKMLREINSILSHIESSRPISTDIKYKKFKGKYGERIIYLHYHIDDATYAKKLDLFLKPLQRSNKIVVYDQSKILAGENILENERDLLSNADLVVSFFSYQYLASDEHVALSKNVSLGLFNANNLLPVIVGPCDWKTEFGELQKFPQLKNHLREYANIEEAFAELTIVIQNILYV